MAQVTYRDRKTGRFVKKATWQRSIARGGKRYKRERPKPKRKRKLSRPPKPPIEEFETIELVGGFDSPGKKRK